MSNELCFDNHVSNFRYHQETPTVYSLQSRLMLSAEPVSFIVNFLELIIDIDHC